MSGGANWPASITSHARHETSGSSRPARRVRNGIVWVSEGRASSRAVPPLVCSVVSSTVVSVTTSIVSGWCGTGVTNSGMALFGNVIAVSFTRPVLAAARSTWNTVSVGCDPRLDESTATWTDASSTGDGCRMAACRITPGTRRSTDGGTIPTGLTSTKSGENRYRRSRCLCSPTSTPRDMGSTARCVPCDITSPLDGGACARSICLTATKRVGCPCASLSSSRKARSPASLATTSRSAPSGTRRVHQPSARGVNTSALTMPAKTGCSKTSCSVPSSWARHRRTAAALTRTSKRLLMTWPLGSCATALKPNARTTCDGAKAVRATST
eukprot:Unigene3071_Nuclearia_a/m.9442 Unigene3071_Nuclearia_a/g.9442  ORF Unigene3071_Nuclearia_a/g.9442 Unigene3071_Nuclearia_a/m.9442 type:complete len:327 (+) Unigene3071_Nuclearia_a:1769-2749(+)